MKKIITFFVLLCLSIILNIAPTNAASIYTSNTGFTIENPKKDDKATTPAKAPKQSFWQRIAHPFRAEGDKDALFYVLCILIGGLGLHRVIVGSKPMMIVWYILATVAGFIVWSLLTSLSFGFFSFIGFLIIYALPISDLIAALMHGTGIFQGNDDIFAGFKGLSGGKK
jgi:hypothetical protein